MLRFKLIAVSKKRGPRDRFNHSFIVTAGLRPGSAASAANGTNQHLIFRYCCAIIHLIIILSRINDFTRQVKQSLFFFYCTQIDFGFDKGMIITLALMNIQHAMSSVAYIVCQGR